MTTNNGYDNKQDDLDDGVHSRKEHSKHSKCKVLMFKCHGVSLYFYC